MRKSPRQVECCAALGPWSQGETAFSPSHLIIWPRRKSKRKGLPATDPNTGRCRLFQQQTRAPKRRSSGGFTNSCGSGLAPSAGEFVASSSGTFAARDGLALQLPFMEVSESMGNHDSKIVDAGSVD